MARLIGLSVASCAGLASQATSTAAAAARRLARGAGVGAAWVGSAASAGAFTTRADPALVKALARAFRYQRMLEQGRYASISEMAAAERIERGYLGSLLRLTLLAPDLVELVLDGRGADRVALPALLKPMPLVWAQQRARLVSDEPSRRAELEAQIAG